MATRDTRLTVGTISKALLWVVYVWLVVNVVLLFLAFLLRLFGANPEAGFTQWIYRSVSRSMAPFRGIFEPIVLSDQSVLDTSLPFAIICYGLAALFLRAGIDWASDAIARHRRRLEQEAWDDRLDAPQPAPTVATQGAMPPHGTTYPNVIVPASRTDVPPGQPPRQ